jgi:putative aminopeptidase C
MGKSGANFFIGFIPLIGPFILLYYLVQPTKEDSFYREERANLLDNWHREAEQ